MSTVSSTPILRTTVIWSAIVTGVLAVVGALVGYLAAVDVSGRAHDTPHLASLLLGSRQPQRLVVASVAA